MIFGWRSVRVFFTYGLSTGVVLSDTSLLRCISRCLRGIIESHSLDNDEDLHPGFRLALQQVIQAISLVPRSSEIQLGRDPIASAACPGVVRRTTNHVCISGLSPCLSLGSDSRSNPAVHQSCPSLHRLTPSTNHCAATLTRRGAKESNRFLPVQTLCAAILSMLTIN